MNDFITHPLAMDGKDPANLRGDPITAERYYSPEYMAREETHLWSKIWHIAGREKQIPDAGDYLVHDFMHESVIVIRQRDGSLKGFYNACGHRGMRLVWSDGSQDALTCPYHGWQWNTDGSLDHAPDTDDFPQGSPCDQVRLAEVRVDTWGSFVWYTMDDAAPSLREYLHPIPEIYQHHRFEETVRTQWIRVALNCNWKFWGDNFNESYHTRTVHPQVPAVIDQDHFTSRYEMFPGGHARIIQMGRPSLRDRVPDGEPHPWDAELEKWGLDPAAYPDYETKVMQGWLDLKAAKRARWREMGHLHYENLSDEDLTESPFQFLFPNIAFGASADGVAFFRWEPHPDDPEKCFFDLWVFAYPVHGQSSYVQRTATKEVPLEEAEYDYRDYNDGAGVQDLFDQVVYQDWQLTAGMRAGWRSRGYQEPFMAAQETRVRFFHETLHDYLSNTSGS